MSSEVSYLIGYGSYLDQQELRTVIDESFICLNGRVNGFMRVFNLPHGSYRYPIKGNLRGVMNVIPRADKHFNCSVISVPNDESWERINDREGKMYDKVEVEVFLTDEPYIGQTVTATMYVGKPDRINQNVYPLPEYYKIVRDAAEEIGEEFLEEYLETTYMQVNGAFLSVKRYEEHAAASRRPDDFTRITGSTESVCVNMSGMPFEMFKGVEEVDVKRDYYLEEMARNIVMNDTTNKLYKFVFMHNKIEFYRGTLGFAAHMGDQSIWSAYERGYNLTKVMDFFFDKRPDIPFTARQPFKIIIDRTILPYPSIVVQSLAQAILGLMNPMTLQPWDSGSTGVQMIWRHYMDGLLDTAITVERHLTDVNLLEPSFFSDDWEPGTATALRDTFVPVFDALTAINNELIARYELVQFPIQLPVNYEADYREDNNRGAYWKQWMWLYSKHDRDTDEIFTFAKFQEHIAERDFIQVAMSDHKNRIKFKRRTFADGHEIKYIMTALRNYTTDAEVDLVVDSVDVDDYEDLLELEEE